MIRGVFDQLCRFEYVQMICKYPSCIFEPPCEIESDHLHILSWDSLRLVQFASPSLFVEIAAMYG
jgi:hypothetical protein